MNGVTLSNKYLLESLGWRGCCEPHPTYAEACRKARPGSTVVQAALCPEGAAGEISFTCADTPAGASSPLPRPTRATRAVQAGGVRAHDGEGRPDLAHQLLHGKTGPGRRGESRRRGDGAGRPAGLRPGGYRRRSVVEEHDRRRDALVDAPPLAGYLRAATRGCNLFYVPAINSPPSGHRDPRWGSLSLAHRPQSRRHHRASFLRNFPSRRGGAGGCTPGDLPPAGPRRPRRRY